MSASNLHRHALVKKGAQDSLVTEKDAPTRSEHPPRISTYPPVVPEHYAGHLLFYGFYCDEQWLMDYARRHTTLNESLSTSRQVSVCMEWFTHHVKRRTGLRNLEYRGAIIDNDTPPNAVIIESEITGTKYHMIVSICEWDRRSWRRRPTLEQVKTISEMMGSPPRWWIDVEIPEYYE